MTNKFVNISRNERRSFQSGMDAISPHQTRFSPERLPIFYVAHVVCWTPSRQPAVEGGHATKHVITGQNVDRLMMNHGLCLLLLKVTQPVWGLGRSGSAKGRLMRIAALGGSTLTKGTWLDTGWFSKVRSRASNSDNIASKTTKRLHLLHVPLSLKEAEE